MLVALDNGRYINASSVGMIEPNQQGGSSVIMHGQRVSVSIAPDDLATILNREELAAEYTNSRRR